VINLDPCSNSREILNVPAAKHYTAEDNGLILPLDLWNLMQAQFHPAPSLTLSGSARRKTSW
jgi:hypothetical protein